MSKNKNKEVAEKDNTESATPSNLEAEKAEVDQTESNDNTLETANQTEPVALDPKKSYKLISLITKGFLKNGNEYNVYGNLAQKMINNNQAKLK